MNLIVRSIRPALAKNNARLSKTPFSKTFITDLLAKTYRGSLIVNVVRGMNIIDFYYLVNTKLQ